MARGIPPNPQNRIKYSGLPEMNPLVLQYDDETGAFKLVTVAEQDDSLHIASGSVLSTFESSQLDAFGRFRIANPRALFDGQFRYDHQPLLWFGDHSGGATGTYNSTRGIMELQVDANQTAAIQTKQYFQHQAGKSQFVGLTALFPADDGVTARAGYFDDNDGLFFEVEDGQARFVLRSSTSGAVVDTHYDQSDWNVDPMDGTGPSQEILDMSNAQNIFVDAQWLGVGTFRFGFNLRGKKRIVHTVDFANRIQAPPDIRTGTLPVRFELSANGTLAGSSTLEVVGSEVLSEGGQNIIQGFPFHVHMEAPVSVNNQIPLLSIRPKALFNSQANRFVLEAERVHAYSADNLAHIGFIYGGALTGPSWLDVDSQFSGTEYDISASAISGGILIGGFYVPAGAGSSAGVKELPLIETLVQALDPDGNHPTDPLSDILTIVASTPGAQASDVQVMMDLRERR